MYIPDMVASVGPVMDVPPRHLMLVFVLCSSLSRARTLWSMNFQLIWIHLRYRYVCSRLALWFLFFPRDWGVVWYNIDEWHGWRSSRDRNGYVDLILIYRNLIWFWSVETDHESQMFFFVDHLSIIICTWCYRIATVLSL